MDISKKLFLLLSLAALSPVVLIASEAETKQKAVNPVVVHIPVEGSERETREGAVSSFENKRKVKKRVSTLPVDPKSKILSYLESPLYEQWKVLNISAKTIIFSKTGDETMLVAIKENPYEGSSLIITTKSMQGNKLSKQFRIPARLTDTNYFSQQERRGYAWSADGGTIAVMNPSGKNIDMWSTRTGKLIQSIPDQVFELQHFDDKCEVLGLSADGTQLFIRVKVQGEAPAPGEGATNMYKIIVFDTKTDKKVFLGDSERFRHGIYTFSADFFFAIQGVFPYEMTEPLCWNVTTGELIPLGLLDQIDESQMINCLFSDDGTLLALMTRLEEKNKIQIFSSRSITSSIAERGFFEVPMSLNNVNISHDNRLLLVGNPIMLYNINTGMLLQDVESVGWQHLPLPAIFSPDDTIIARSTYGGGIQLWKKSTALQDLLHKAERIQEMRRTPKSFVEYLTRKKALQNVYFKEPAQQEFFKKSQEAQENLEPVVEPVDVTETDISQVD